MRLTVFEAFDQFVITDTDGSTRDSALIGVVRVVPEQGVPGDSLIATQQRNEAFAVEMLFRPQADSGQVQDCWVEVRTDDWCVADVARL